MDFYQRKRLELSLSMAAFVLLVMFGISLAIFDYNKEAEATDKKRECYEQNLYPHSVRTWAKIEVFCLPSPQIAK